jgi:hypothetical protein
MKERGKEASFQRPNSRVHRQARIETEVTVLHGGMSAAPIQGYGTKPMEGEQSVAPQPSRRERVGRWTESEGSFMVRA